MSASNLDDKNAVIKAMNECDALGRKSFLKKYGFGQAYQYFLIHNGRYYDSKAIVGVAHRYQYGTPLTSKKSYAGKTRTKPILEKMGFTVKTKQEIREEPSFAEEISDVHWEGERKTITVNAYERDKGARLKCIEHYGTHCSICEFDFGEVYGDEFSGFIHVHHLTPVSEVGKSYKVDPVNDLLPICANCHAIIHHGRNNRSIDEVRELMGKSVI